MGVGYKRDITQKILSLESWKILVIVVLSSEVLTALINIANSLIWFGRLDKPLLIIGAIDDLVVSLIVGGIVIAILDMVRKREAEVRIQKKQADQLIEAIGDPIAIIDRDYVITYQNSVALKMNGDIRFRKCYEAVHGRDARCEECPAEKAFRDGLAHTAIRQRTINGENRRFENTASPVHDDQGNVTAVLEIVRDITARLRTEEKLRRSEQDLKRAQSIARMGSWSWDITTNDVTWSGETYNIYGFDPETFLPDYKTVTGAMHPDSLAPFLEAIDGALNLHKPFELDYTLIRTDGELRTIHTKGEVIYDESDKPIHMYGTVYDITERKKAEEASARLAIITEQTAEGIAVANLNGIVTYSNLSWARMHGYCPDEIVGRPLGIFHTREQIERDVVPFNELLMQNGSNSGEVGHVRKDGTEFPAYMTSTLLVDKSGKSIGIVGFAADITERKRIEEELRGSLREKEILLREIHHRVKNNLAIIMSLLRMQQRYSESPEVQSVLLESRNRIKSMALIHEKLYMMHDLLRIDCRDYIQSLVDELIASYKTVGHSVARELDIGDMALNIDTMIPLGLIINEFVTNSLKYARRKDETLMLGFSLKPSEGEQYELRVWDNGPGLPDGIDMENSGGLGFQIVTGLVRQIHGSMEIEKSGGAAFRIVFRQLNVATGEGGGGDGG